MKENEINDKYMEDKETNEKYKDYLSNFIINEESIISGIKKN